MMWEEVPLSDVSSIVGGATPKSKENSFWGGDIYWATPKDLSNLDSIYISKTVRSITQAGLNSCAASILPENSVLFSSRAPIGHVAINKVPMATNQGFKSIVPGPLLDAKFVYWWFKHNRKRLEGLGTGATFKELSKSAVERVLIPLPPMTEQKRIAAILDQAAELVRLRKEALAKLDVLGQAIFHDMFGDPFTNHMSFCKQRILDFGDVTTGNTPSRKEPKYYGDDIEWVNSNNLNDSNPFVGEASEYLSTVGASKARIAPKNSVLVTCIAGSRESIGNVAMTDRDVAFNQQINSLSLPSEHMCIFIYGQLRFHKELVRAQSRGGMKGIVNKTRFSEVLLLSPPEDLIKDYANKWAHLDVMRKNAEQSLNKSKALRASLINQCFT